MAFGSGQDVEITLKVDAQGAITVLNKTGDELEKLEKKGKDAGKGIDKAESSLDKLTGQAKKAAAAFLSFQGASKFLQGLGKGAAFNDLTDAFDRLSKNAGVLSSTLLNDLRRATLGTISDFELLRQANEGLRAGLKPDELVVMADAARVLANETGQSLTQALQTVSTAFETGNTKILKNTLGVIDLEAAEKRLAAQLGGTREQLTREGQVMAGRNAIYDAAITTVAAAGKAEEDLGDVLEQVTTVFLNNGEEAFAAAAKNEQVVTAFKLLKEQVDALAPGLKDLVGILAEVAGGLALIAAKALEAAGSFGDGLRTKFERLFPPAKKFGEIMEGVADELREGTPQATKNAISHYNQLANIINKNSGIAAAWRKEFTILGAAVQASGEKFGLSAAKVEEIAKAADKTAPKAKILGKGLLDASVNAKKLADEAGKASKAVDGLGDVQGPANNEGITDFLDRQAADSLAQAQEIGSQIGAAIAQGISMAFAGTLDAKGAGGLVGSTAGTIGGAFAGGAIGAAFGPIGMGVGAIIGSQVGGALGEGIGTALGGFLGGKDSASTKFRKEIDKYFADLFDATRISVVIEGQLSQLKDFDFGGSNFGSVSSGFFDVFKGLDGQAQNAFGGVALAFSKLQGRGEEFAVNLSAVLANNLGGELENLQRLIDGMGVSFEQLAEQLINSGNTAFQVQEQMMALADVMAVGIPGAVGAVDEAFANLDASIGGPADAMIRAVEDIGAEILQLGINDFGDAQAAMINSFGISEEAAIQFFTALQVVGIDSFNELGEASEEQLLAIAANLEALRQGLAATFSAVENPEITPTVAPRSSSGGSSSGASRAQSEAKRAREAFLNDLSKLITESEKYKTVTSALIAGQIDEKNANAQLLAVRQEAQKLLKAANKAQEDHDKALAKGTKNMAKYAAEVERTNKALADLSGTQKALKEFDPVKDFLSGKLNAGDAAKQLDLAGPGIPGLKGGISEAFQNFLTGGTSGGAFTTDALRDIAAEAKEVGATALDGIINVLEGNGTDRGQLQLFVLEAAKLGIKDIDQLAGVSNETAIKLINNLSESGFAFSETSAEVRGLLDELNKIPDQKYIDIVLNVSSQYVDEGTRRLAGNLLADSGYGSSGDAPGVPTASKKPRNRKKKNRTGVHAS